MCMHIPVVAAAPAVHTTSEYQNVSCADSFIVWQTANTHTQTPSTHPPASHAGHVWNTHSRCLHNTHNTAADTIGQHCPSLLLLRLNDNNNTKLSLLDVATRVQAGSQPHFVSTRQTCCCCSCITCKLSSAIAPCCDPSHTHAWKQLQQTAAGRHPLQYRHTHIHTCTHPKRQGETWSTHLLHTPSAYTYPRALPQHTHSGGYNKWQRAYTHHTYTQPL